MGILFTITMGFLFTITLGILFTIVLGIQFTISKEVIEFAKATGEIKFDNKICKEASLEDIDKAKVKWFLKKATKERNFDVDPETSIKEVLEKLELIKDGKLTNAAILLFGKNPQRFFLQAETRCARFKGLKTNKTFYRHESFWWEYN